jgi:3-oxoacyl-[acyl-carrier protein] reductase
MRFKDKVVLITWASRGIWRALALYFWKEGAFVVVNYLSGEKEANAIVANIKKFSSSAIAIKCDVANEKEVKSMINETIKTFWRIDILVNNAGIYINKPIFDRTTEDWNKVINTNLLGTFLCSKYVCLEMLKNKNWWKIINLSSINGTKFFSPDEIDYDVSKAWIIALTKDFAKAFAPKILVNAIAPWNIDTESTKENSAQSYEEDIENIYLKRFWKVQEVVKTILFLASDEASYINWTTIYIDWWFSC